MLRRCPITFCYPQSFHFVFPIQHYASIMKYISQPPLLLDVHIHKPLLPARTWMDSLLAFFPGLQVRLSPHASKHFLGVIPLSVTLYILLLLCVSQVLKGDIRPAIETHEMLYQVTKKHNFLPEVKIFSTWNQECWAWIAPHKHLATE